MMILSDRIRSRRLLRLGRASVVCPHMTYVADLGCERAVALATCQDSIGVVVLYGSWWSTSEFVTFGIKSSSSFSLKLEDVGVDSMPPHGSVLSLLFPCRMVNFATLHVAFLHVLKPKVLPALFALPFLKFAVENAFSHSLLGHPSHMATPAQLTSHQVSFNSPNITATQYFRVSDTVRPFDVQNVAEGSQMEFV